MSDPFKNALAFLDDVKKHLSKENQKYLLRLKRPHKVYKKTIVVKGKRYKAFRSQHNNALGPYKGGIRFHQNVTESEVKALSLWMSLKCSVSNLPFGGGKGGIAVNPKKLSEKELEELSRAYVRFIAPFIGEKKDIPAPDVNTNDKIMALMLDEYEKIIGYKAPGTFTGKPLEIGGSKGRGKATGFGGVLALTFLLEKLKKEKGYEWVRKPKSQITVAVQGYGNVGYYFAKLASDIGLKVVAASDSKGAVYVKDGLDPVSTLECKREKGGLLECYCIGGKCSLEYGRGIDNERILELPVDILVPAALENVITKKNAENIKAKIIVEMANGPVTPDADKILARKGILVIPDIYANSGGVSTSYFEWVQNLSGDYWEEDEVDRRLERLMKKSFEKIWKKFKELKKKDNNVSLRTAAYVLAVEKIIKAEKLRRP